MTLTTTPGAADADSYATVEEFTAYHDARGTTYAASPTSAIENALRRGTQYLDNAYRGRWQGYRTNETQALAWPRIGSGGDSRFRFPGQSFAIYGIIDEDGFEIGADVVPAQIKNAAIEAALITLSGATLEPTLVRGGNVTSLTEQVGPISTSTTWAAGASPLDRFTAIEGLLRGLVTSTPGAGSGNVRLVRS